MNILHYSLGLPPYRTGGLTKYSFDLMKEQVRNGDNIYLLFPGKISFMSSKTRIKYYKNESGVIAYEIVNPLPVPLDEGITDIAAYTMECDKNVYKKFLEKYKPEAVHIHTLMGLHREFIEATKEIGIKTVFTTHDYYGLCPKVTLFCKGHTCDQDNECRNCVKCNQTALSLKKIQLMQSQTYRSLKDSELVKMLRRRHRRDFFDGAITSGFQISDTETEIRAAGYRRLRAYYISILAEIDMIHFNSTVSEMVYKRYFEPKDSKVISITHSGIADHRKIKKISHDKLSITYLAPTKPFKGFDVLKEALDKLWNQGKRNFELNIFSLTNKVAPYMNIQDGYKYEELEGIFDRTDLLVAPSVWYETFGFTVLEAISYGVPVIVSDHVGAKDVVGSGGIVVEAGNVEQLKSVIKSFDKKKQMLLRQQILDTVEIKQWDEFINETYNLYVR